MENEIQNQHGKINELWVRDHLWEILYAWERGAGNLISHDPELGAPLVRHIMAELQYAGGDPREGEWETSIAQIAERQDNHALLDLIQWIATDSHSAAAIMASKSRKNPTQAQRKASRENGKKGGRPKTKTIHSTHG